jgi:hypothetical protein
VCLSVLQWHHLDDQGWSAQAQLLGIPYTGQHAVEAGSDRHEPDVISISITSRLGQGLANAAGSRSSNAAAAGILGGLSCR